MEGILQYLMGWELLPLIFLIVGIVLMIVEMFLPGFGVPGILGLISLIAAIVLRGEFFITFTLIVAVLGISALIIFRSFSKGLISRSPIVLKEAIHQTSTPLQDADMQSLIGHEGISLTALRPAGNALIGGKKYDVCTSGEFLRKDSRIKVMGVEGLRILVEEISAESAPDVNPIDSDCNGSAVIDKANE